MTGQPWQFCGSIAHTGPAEILSKAGNGKFRLEAVIEYANRLLYDCAYSLRMLGILSK